MDSGFPCHTLVPSKLIDDRAPTFKTDANAEGAALPPGATPFFLPLFKLIDLPMRGRGHV